MMFHRRPWAPLALTLAVAGCSTPQTPGAGYGAEYTPVIDLQGVNLDAYSRDLTACRNMARNINVNQATAEGALAGMFIGALVSGALGGGRQTTIDSANIGAMSGMGRTTGDALAGQKRIVVNCMVGRGYRALEVTPALGSYQQGSPGYPTAQTTAPRPLMAPAPAPDAPPLPPKSSAPIGQFAYTAERIPESRSCSPYPRAALASKGPGFEVYTVACDGGDVLMIRCEMGNCRAMR